MCGFLRAKYSFAVYGFPKVKSWWLLREESLGTVPAQGVYSEALDGDPEPRSLPQKA